MINLSLVKSHLLIEHDEDDELLHHYINAAILYAEDVADKEIIEDGVPTERQVLINPKIIQACLLVIGEWYEVRENVTFKKGSELPSGFISLMWPSRCHSV